MSNQLEPAIEAAWAYERLHVNALFQQWVEPVLGAAGVITGHGVSMSDAARVWLRVLPSGVSDRGVR